MGLPSADFETDREQIAAIITNRAPELSPAPTAFAGELAGAQAQITQSIGGDIDQAGRDAVPSSDSSEQGLTNWAIAVGISNGAGGYGPRGATYAQGFAAYLTGEGGTVYAAGQQATASGITLRLRNSVTIPGTSGSGQVLGTWDADTSSRGSAGTAGNLSAGTELTLVSPPPTSDSTITLSTGPSVPGQDAEPPSSVLSRIQFKMQRPPNGGNGTDYVIWGTTATDPSGNPVTTGLLFGFVYPNYYGDGSPLLLLLQAGSGLSRLVPAPVLAAVDSAVNGSTTREGQRPIGTDCTVRTGHMPELRQLTYYIRCVPSKAAYAFDWSRGATSYVVDNIQTTGLPGWATAAGANAVLTLTGLAPVTLKDGISAAVGPRIQVDSRDTGTGLPLGPVVPEQWPCLAYQDALGKTSLGLKVPSVTNFGAWVQAGNAVYAGGPIVTPVSASVLASTDQNGPSRASGLADRAQLWSDTIGVTTLSTAAEGTLDADGVTRLVARCIAGGVRIGIGSAAPVVQDVVATDNTIDGPEVLRAGRILISD
jgi:hypothetical protein